MASFPIMTMAISVVTNQYYPLQNHIQVAEIAAEMKNYAKSFSHSTFVVDDGRITFPVWHTRNLTSTKLGK